MTKTKESIAVYNKEYFARPEVIAHAKVRNAKRRQKRAEYKKTEAGILANKRYKSGITFKTMLQKNRLKTRYGLTLEDVERLKLAQSNRCAICNKKPNNWNIDHDHNTNKVRGMLCGPCNMALGLMKDKSTNLRKAADYLDASV
jgi:hypothetical protein